MSPKGDQPAAGSRPIGVGVVTGRGDRDGNTSKEVAMRPIRTIAPLALGLIALAVAGCQSRPDQPTTPPPPPIQRAAPRPGVLPREGAPPAYGAAELDLHEPVARRVGPNAYEVGATDSEWAATLY